MADQFSGETVAQLLGRFVALTQEIDVISHVGRHNRLHATRRRVVDAIKAQTDGTVRALRPLTEHPDPEVRLTAAFYYGELDPSIYIQVLTELAQRKDKVGQDAASSLVWRKDHPFSGPAEPSEEKPSKWDSYLSRHAPPKGITRAELKPLLFDAFPHDTAKSLLALARPAIRIWPQPLAADAPLTGSRLGGLPAVPRDWSWPTEEVWPKGVGLEWLTNARATRTPVWHEPFWFLGQINCADLAGFAAAKSLPKDGLLSFFADSDVVTGCSGPGGVGGLYHFCAQELLVLAPEPVEDFERMPACGLGFAEALDLPDPSSQAIAELALSEELRDRYWDVRQRILTFGVPVERYDTIDRSKLFGWPDLVQGELEMARDERDALLLFQLGNYDNGNTRWSWGPGGLIYFIISAGSLAAGRFDGACHEMQCT